TLDTAGGFAENLGNAEVSAVEGAATAVLNPGYGIEGYIERRGNIVNTLKAGGAKDAFMTEIHATALTAPGVQDIGEAIGNVSFENPNALSPPKASTIDRATQFASG